MTRNKDNLLSLKAHQGESVAFEYGKKDNIINILKVSKYHSYTIENVYMLRVSNTFC